MFFSCIHVHTLDQREVRHAVDPRGKEFPDPKHPLALGVGSHAVVGDRSLGVLQQVEWQVLVGARDQAL